MKYELKFITREEYEALGSAGAWVNYIPHLDSIPTRPDSVHEEEMLYVTRVEQEQDTNAPAI